MTALWWNKLLRKQSTQRRVKRNLVATRKRCLDSKMTDSGIRMKAQQDCQFWMSKQAGFKTFHKNIFPFPSLYFRPLLGKTYPHRDRTQANKNALTKRSHTSFRPILQSVLVCIQQCVRLCAVGLKKSSTFGGKKLCILRNCCTCKDKKGHVFQPFSRCHMQKLPKTTVFCSITCWLQSGAAEMFVPNGLKIKMDTKIDPEMRVNCGSIFAVIATELHSSRGNLVGKPNRPLKVT